MKTTSTSVAVVKLLCAANSISRSQVIVTRSRGQPWIGLDQRGTATALWRLANFTMVTKPRLAFTRVAI
nr:hypothetical protein [Kibdelosporangium sp. MJ126-NF4]